MANIIKFNSSEGIDQKLIELEPGFFHGSRGPASDDVVLIQYGVTQVLSITSVTLPPIRAACRWHLAVDDGQGWSEEQIDFVKAFCMFVFTHHPRAIIHCDHGASRSSGGVILWKMLKDGMSRDTAYAWLRSINPYANCRQEILDSLPVSYDFTK